VNKESKKKPLSSSETLFPGYVDNGIDIEECIKLVSDRSSQECS